MVWERMPRADHAGSCSRDILPSGRWAEEKEEMTSRKGGYAPVLKSSR